MVKVTNTKLAATEGAKVHGKIVAAVKSAMNGPGGFTAEARTILRRDDTIVSGKLRQSTLGAVEDEGKRILGIVHTETYGPYVEYGTRPHWPPFQPIYEWVVKRGLGVTYKGEARISAGKIKRTKDKPATETAQRSLAYLIQRKIARFGTAPKPFIAPAVKVAWDKLLRDLRALLGGDA